MFGGTGLWENHAFGRWVGEMAGQAAGTSIWAYQLGSRGGMCSEVAYYGVPGSEKQHDLQQGQHHVINVSPGRVQGYIKWY